MDRIDIIIGEEQRNELLQFLSLLPGNRPALLRIDGTIGKTTLAKLIITGLGHPEIAELVEDNGIRYYISIKNLYIDVYPYLGHGRPLLGMKSPADYEYVLYLKTNDPEQEDPALGELDLTQRRLLQKTFARKFDKMRRSPPLVAPV